MPPLELHDPFVQLILQSTAVTVALIFFVRYAVEIVVPGLGRPLFVPLSVALFCGTLCFLAEKARNRYAPAILEFLAAMALFPLLAWSLLILFHIPFQTKEADFIALIPQGIAAPSFFEFIRRRFGSGEKPGISEKVCESTSGINDRQGPK